MFELKKFVAFWLMPLPFCLTLLIVGLWLSSLSRRARLGRGLIAAGLLLLLLFTNRAVSTWMIRPLETIYVPVPEITADAPLPADLAACRAVVVLGGGHGDTPGLAAVNKLSPSAQARLLEAVRLLRAMPDEVALIVCGRGAPRMPTHAQVLADAAVSLGVAPERIVRLDTPRDTEEEAAALRERFGAAPFALVTSAWHLRRAVTLMRGAGLQPIPCPADYAVRPQPTIRWTDFLWDSESLSRSTLAIRERLGLLWAQLRGKTAS